MESLSHYITRLFIPDLYFRSLTLLLGLNRKRTLPVVIKTPSQNLLHDLILLSLWVQLQKLDLTHLGKTLSFLLFLLLWVLFFLSLLCPHEYCSLLFPFNPIFMQYNLNTHCPLLFVGEIKTRWFFFFYISLV